MRAFLAAAITTATFTAAAVPAHAETLPEMIPRLIKDSGWLRAHYPGQEDSSAPKTSFEHPEPSAAPHAFMGSNVHFAFVARDWRHSYSLTDGKALLFDRIRLISSSRMAVQRVSLAGGKFLPYAEVSFGQWRADPELMPYLHSQYELAAQVAAGFEMHVAPRCSFAWDVERTSLFRDTRDPNDLPFASAMASFAALRAEF